MADTPPPAPAPQEMPSASTGTTASSGGTVKLTEQRVIVRPMPKIIFFYFTWLVSLLFGIVVTIKGTPGEHLGTIWMCVFAIRDQAGEVTEIYNEDNSPYGIKI